MGLPGSTSIAFVELLSNVLLTLVQELQVTGLRKVLEPTTLTDRPFFLAFLRWRPHGPGDVLHSLTDSLIKVQSSESHTAKEISLWKLVQPVFCEPHGCSSYSECRRNFEHGLLYQQGGGGSDSLGPPNYLLPRACHSQS